MTAQATPADVVQKLQDTLIISSGISSFEERLETLSPVIKKTHNFSVIARLVTGRHWRKFEAQQREQFIRVFTQLSVVTYADRFKNLGASKFSYVETLEQPRSSKKIISTLALDSNADFSELSDKRQFTFEYILQPVNSSNSKDDDSKNNESSTDQWQIINVIVDGVSDLALKRSNYVSTLNEQGFDSLMIELNDKISSMREKSS